MIIEIGCRVDLDEKWAAVQVELAEMQQLGPNARPVAVLVAFELTQSSAWHQVLAAFDKRTPIIAVLDRPDQLAKIPFGVHDFLIAPFEPVVTSARIDVVIRAMQRAVDETEQLQGIVQRSERLSAIGAIAAGVAHDVRNRLFGISATIDAFANEIGDNPQLEPFVDVLNTELARLSALTTDLLDYGKAASLSPRSGQLRSAISEAIKLSEKLARECRTQVTVHYGDIPALTFDHHQLVRVFHNLLINAIQHAPTGNVTIDAGRELLDGRDYATVRVSDNGPGFPPNSLQRVFEPYYSGRATGVGLGLAIAQRIVEAHHGRVSAANRDEGGAVISISIPLEAG